MEADPMSKFMVCHECGRFFDTTDGTPVNAFVIAEKGRDWALCKQCALSISPSYAKIFFRTIAQPGNCLHGREGLSHS
jgi:hypothetical protein